MATILIVDDAGVVRNLLRVYLEKAGHTVIAEANNGKEACILYEKHRPDLVTMDITMPSMSGIEAIKTIIQFDQKAKIIVVSAIGLKARIIEAIQAGAKHFIVKPFTSEKVCQIVNKVLDQT